MGGIGCLPLKSRIFPKRSGWASGPGRANIGASTTILALGGIDHIIAIDFGDCAIGALGFASAALNAVIFVDNVSHGISSSLQNLIIDNSC